MPSWNLFSIAEGVDIQSFNTSLHTYISTEGSEHNVWSLIQQHSSDTRLSLVCGTKRHCWMFSVSPGTPTLPHSDATSFNCLCTMEETRIENYSSGYAFFFSLFWIKWTVSAHRIYWLIWGTFIVHLWSATTKSMEGNIPNKNNGLKQVLLKQCLRK